MEMIYLWVLVVLITPIASFLSYHTSVTLYYGRAIASEEMLRITPRGLQDHLTNPKYNWLFFLIHAARLILIAAMFYWGGFLQGFLLIAVVFAVAYLMKKIVLPAPDSMYWSYGLLRTVSNREADYGRDNDVLRAEEMRAVKEALINYLAANKK